MPGKRRSPSQTYDWATMGPLELHGGLTFATKYIQWLIDVTGESARGQIADVAAFMARTLNTLDPPTAAVCKSVPEVMLMALEIETMANKADLSWEVLREKILSKTTTIRMRSSTWV